MTRRAMVAAAVVAVAVTVGIVRGVTHDQNQPATPTPTVAAAPAPSTSIPAQPATTPIPPTSPQTVTPAAEPVNEGAGEGPPSTGAGRDTGPAASAGTDRRVWEPVATGFGRSFTTVRRGDTTDIWRARLRPYVTVAVDKQLATVDVTRVPEGQFDGLDVLDASDEQVTVQATYRPGWALVLYLVSDGHDHWKVYRYDRLEQ